MNKRRYPAQLLRIVDGDTYKMQIDLGFKVHVKWTVRLYGWDTPELRPRKGTDAEKAKEKVMARRAALAVEDWMQRNHDEKGRVIIVTRTNSRGGMKVDSFGRCLAEVVSYELGPGLGAYLASIGLAEEYRK